MEPSHYDYVPPMIQKKIVATHGANKAPDDEE
jgi:hypothetical protein